MTKRRIILKPIAVFDRGGYHRAVIERYLDGCLIGSEASEHLFPSERQAEQFADAAAAGVVDELIHHYGDRFSFTICHPARAELPIPGFLLREYRPGARGLQ